MCFLLCLCPLLFIFMEQRQILIGRHFKFLFEAAVEVFDICIAHAAGDLNHVALSLPQGMGGLCHSKSGDISAGGDAESLGKLGAQVGIVGMKGFGDLLQRQIRVRVIIVDISA